MHVGDPVALEHLQTGLKLLVEAPLPDGRYEVTAAHAVTGFKLNLFRSFADTAESGALLGCSFVRLRHKEANGYLGCERAHDDAEQSAFIQHIGTHSTHTIWQCVRRASVRSI